MELVNFMNMTLQHDKYIQTFMKMSKLKINMKNI